MALDLLDLSRAAGIASRIAGLEGGLVLEVGTPLVKSAGAAAISVVKSVAGGRPVVADTKTADAGAVEVQLASDAGADAVTVLAAAPDPTVEEVVREARRRGVAVIADLLGVRDPLSRAEELASLGVDVVEVHVGVDAQRLLGVTAASMEDVVRRVSERFPGPVAVAGGLNAETAPRMVRAGASIVVVGGAIVRAEDPVAAAREILRRIGEAAGR
ncbi:MAG: orotidine 5'-phosphate decarboxylase / HUMPS family protein [Thermoproteota archaeon]